MRAVVVAGLTTQARSANASSTRVLAMNTFPRFMTRFNVAFVVLIKFVAGQPRRAVPPARHRQPVTEQFEVRRGIHRGPQ
jgi:hypothetical protein